LDVFACGLFEEFFIFGLCVEARTGFICKFPMAMERGMGEFGV
jgi:hypothetical protein